MSVVSVTVLWLDLSAYIWFSVVLWMSWPENQITRQLRALQRAETGFHCLLFFLRHLFFWNDAQTVIGRPCCRSLYSVQDTNVVAALNSFGIQVQFCAEQCKKKTPHSKFANEGYLWADFIKVQFSGAVQLLFLWHFRDLIKEEISSINIFILWVNWTHRKKGHSFVLLHLFHEKTQPFFFRSPRDFKLLWNLSPRGTSHCTPGFINMIVVIYLSSTISCHLPKFLR